eukprot:scaffold28468_cov26-Tisochrysis_lutea.AAC.1
MCLASHHNSPGASTEAPPRLASADLQAGGTGYPAHGSNPKGPAAPTANRSNAVAGCHGRSASNPKRRGASCADLRRAAGASGLIDVAGTESAPSAGPHVRLCRSWEDRAAAHQPALHAKRTGVRSGSLAHAQRVGRTRGTDR